MSMEFENWKILNMIAENLAQINAKLDQMLAQDAKTSEAIIEMNSKIVLPGKK